MLLLGVLALVTPACGNQDILNDAVDKSTDELVDRAFKSVPFSGRAFGMRANPPHGAPTITYSRSLMSASDSAELTALSAVSAERKFLWEEVNRRYEKLNRRITERELDKEKEKGMKDSKDPAGMQSISLNALQDAPSEELKFFGEFSSAAVSALFVALAFFSLCSGLTYAMQYLRQSTFAECGEPLLAAHGSMV